MEGKFGMGDGFNAVSLVSLLMGEWVFGMSRLFGKLRSGMVCLVVLIEIVYIWLRVVCLFMVV